MKTIDQLVGQKASVPDGFDPDPLQDLPHDDLDVLIVNGHTLVPVDGLDLFQQITLGGIRPFDPEQIVWVFDSIG